CSVGEKGRERQYHLAVTNERLLLLSVNEGERACLMESNIEALEKRLWTAADQLRANSDFASNEYFLPIMGLIFLRHAYSRYLAVKPEIEAGLPSRGGVTRPLTKEDFTS